MLEGLEHFTGSNTMQRFPSGLSWWSAAYSHEPRRLVLPGPPDRIWSERWLAYIPFWEIAALAAILPVLWMTTPLRRRHRNQSGLCPVCGYDLRATPGRCPECGEEAAPKTQSDGKMG
jgi:hypothetical protein